MVSERQFNVWLFSSAALIFAVIQALVGYGMWKFIGTPTISIAYFILMITAGRFIAQVLSHYAIAKCIARIENFESSLRLLYFFHILLTAASALIGPVLCFETSVVTLLTAMGMVLLGEIETEMVIFFAIKIYLTYLNQTIELPTEPVAVPAPIGLTLPPVVSFYLSPLEVPASPQRMDSVRRPGF